jgi:hypothetical protein
MNKALCLLLLFAIPTYGKVVIDDAMSSKQKERTGINTLNYSQKMALQEWINNNFTPIQDEIHPGREQLYLSLNIGEGSRLELSNGHTYEIDPDDRIYSSFWITPIPLMLGPSNDTQYPTKITNLNTGTSVNGKRISTQKLIEESERLDRKAPPPKEQAPPPKPHEKQ